MQIPKAFAHQSKAIKYHAICSKPKKRVTICVIHASEPDNSEANQPKSSEIEEYPDPEAKFRRYGRYFGGIHRLENPWFENVPRVRIRTSDTKPLDALIELAVLNERLAGNQPWEVRRRLEYLRMRRKHWERIYEYVTKQDAVATLDLIEEASRKVDAALSEEFKENSSISFLKDQLMQLQQDVGAAMQKLQGTQNRIDENIKKINELKAEAVALERLQAARNRATASSSARSSLSSFDSHSLFDSFDEEDRGPYDSFRNHWHPIAFTANLAKDVLVPFDIYDEPWVLFRDERGSPSCIHDQCAHRACPLSLGTIIDGQVQCPYHGWTFNGDGMCTKMPSTVFCRGIGVAALPCLEEHGLVWVWPGHKLPAAIPGFGPASEGYQVLSQFVMEMPVDHELLVDSIRAMPLVPFSRVLPTSQATSPTNLAIQAASTFIQPLHVSTVLESPSVLVSTFSLSPSNEHLNNQATAASAASAASTPSTTATASAAVVSSTAATSSPASSATMTNANHNSPKLQQLYVILPAKSGTSRVLVRASVRESLLMRVPGVGAIWREASKQALNGLAAALGRRQEARKATTPPGGGNNPLLETGLGGPRPVT